jgi:hypothetical protein
MDMFKKRSAALPSGQQATVNDTTGGQTRRSISSPNRIYWPGALLGTLVGATYPIYYVGNLILQTHPGQPMQAVMIDQGYIYLVVAAAVVPAFITAKVFELLLGAVFQKHNR